MDPSFLDLLRNHAARTPDAPCLAFEEEIQSFRAFDTRSSRVANALAGQGIKPGDRVAILSHAAPVFYELLFGCAKAGAIMISLNWRLSPGEIAAILADGTPRLILVTREMLPKLSEIAARPEVIDLDTDYALWRDAASPVDPKRPYVVDDTVLLLYTSGTTGLPKGVMLSHRNLSFGERIAREAWQLTARSVNLASMPLFHVGGIGYGMMGFTQGALTVLLRQPEPRALIEAIERHHVTHAFLVPAVIQRLADYAEANGIAPKSLERMVYGGAPIGEALLRHAIRVLGCGFCHAYGMTEAAGTVISLAPEEHDPDGPRAARLRSCGLPFPWVELALVNPATGTRVAVGEVGEIRIRSGMVMRGYWQKPKETAAAITPDGWLCTGDAAYQDADGYVYIHDRYKDMIISGGENIYPTEVENVLYDHPAVSEVAVIGLPHPQWGETPKAFVVARAGANPSEAELIAFTRSRLAHYKCPTAVAFVAALPRNASGKLLKREMRDEKWLREQG